MAIQVEDKRTPDNATERRRFVRVQDAVGLYLQRLVERPAAGQPHTDIEPPAVRKTDKYAIEGYASVRKDFPAVAQYITDLEERIRELLIDGDTASSKATHKVGLSAGGLSFSDKNLYVPGEQISMSITLFPSGIRIGTDALIVSANDVGEVLSHDYPTYRAEFVRISDSDRQVIDTHVDQLLSKRIPLHEG